VAAGLAEPDRLVTIVEPKATWPTEFEAISTSIRNALGPLALRIDQIGSTSVPDLPAKDVIDVQVPVPALFGKHAHLYRSQAPSIIRLSGLCGAGFLLKRRRGDQ
jgi:GrpB-like predicted nucleotidyltransferase (UPF0157 family)